MKPLELFLYAIGAVGVITASLLPPVASGVCGAAVLVAFGLVIGIINYERGMRDAYSVANHHIKEAEQLMNRAYALNDAAQQTLEATRKVAGL